MSTKLNSRHDLKKQASNFESNNSDNGPRRFLATDLMMSPYAAMKSLFRPSPSARRRNTVQTVAVPAILETLEKRQLMTAFIGVDAAALGSSHDLVGTKAPITGPTLSLTPGNQVIECTSTSAHSNTLTESSNGFTFTATASSTSQVKLNWNPANGATGYLIDIWQNGAWKQIGNMNAATTGVTVTGLAAGTTYYFDVGAYNSAGVSWANYQTVTTWSAIQAPILTATATSSTQVQLSWTASSGATGYAVDMWSNNAWVQIGTVSAGTTSVKVTGLAASTTYYFDVGASYSGGTKWASYQSVTTLSGTNGTIDHPTAGAAYTPVSGSLFGSNGPKFTDIHQGNEGVCWLMCSLAEVAARAPGDITSMFTAAGTTVENGTTVNLFKVRFYDNHGTAQYVTVDTELPGGGTYYDQVSNGVLWVALAEKAYAEANGLGYVTSGKLNLDAYDALNGGDPSWALHAITGLSSSDYAVNPSNMASAWNSGKFICLGSSSSANDNLIVGDSQGTHAYAVVGYNSASSNPFELYNPWGASSTVNGTITYNGKAVYGGAFWANATLISNDFAEQNICGQAMVDVESSDVLATIVFVEGKLNHR